MTFAELKTELQSRTNSLSELRAGRFVNDAYQELCECYSWPFLETTASGAAPLTVSDLRQVLEVVHDEDKLAYLTHYVASELDPALDDTGTPTAYYLSSPTEISVLPASTDSISVRYLKIPSELSGDSDTPVVPTRYHGLIVDMAQLRAARRHNEDQAMLPYLVQAVEHEKAKMAAALFRVSVEPQSLVSTDPFG